MTLICFCALLVFNTWHFDYIPNAMDDLRLAVDDEGMAHVVSFAGGTVIYAMRVAVGDSFVWSTEVVVTDAVQPYSWYGTSVDIAVDGNSDPYITYCKEGPSIYTATLYYACRDSAGTWNSTMIDTTMLKTGIICDSLNHPHIVYSRCSSSEYDGVWHKYWDGSTWNTEYVGSYGWNGGYVSLIIDKKDQLHMSLGAPLIDGENRSEQYGFRDSIGWHLEYMGYYDARWPMGIAVDTNCNPHLVFEDYPYDEFYVTKQNGEWIGEDITYLDYRFNTCITIIDEIPHLLGWRPYYPVYTYHLWKSDSNDWLSENIHIGVPKEMVTDPDGYIHCLILENGYQPIYGTNKPQPGIEEAKSVNIVTTQKPTIFSGPLELPPYKNIKILDITGSVVTPANIESGIYFIEIDGIITEKIIKIR